MHNIPLRSNHFGHSKPLYMSIITILINGIVQWYYLARTIKSPEAGIAGIIFF